MKKAAVRTRRQPELCLVFERKQTALDRGSSSEVLALLKGSLFPLKNDAAFLPGALS